NPQLAGGLTENRQGRTVVGKGEPKVSSELNDGHLEHLFYAGSMQGLPARDAITPEYYRARDVRSRRCRASAAFPTRWQIEKSVQSPAANARINIIATHT